MVRTRPKFDSWYRLRDHLPIRYSVIMHFHAEVWVASNEDVEKQIAAAMAPFREDYEKADDKGWWDW